MIGAVGGSVKSLCREDIGGIFNLDSLVPGQVREATFQELQALNARIPMDLTIRGNQARKGLRGTSTDARKANLRGEPGGVGGRQRGVDSL